MRAVISIKTIKTMGTQSILAAKVPENEINKLEKKSITIPKKDKRNLELLGEKQL